MAKKYYWLKLQKDFFKRHDVRIIESMDNGERYILFYLKLLVESIDHEGNLRFSETIPYDDKMLSTITNTNVDIVRSAVKIFTELGLMETLTDKTIFMNEISKMVGAETDWKNKKIDYRNRKSLKVVAKDLPSKYPYALGNCKVTTESSIMLPNGIVCNVDEKRYGGNGKIAIARSNGKCEKCGQLKEEEYKLLIHHMNGYSNELEDLKVLCSKCHGKEHRQKEDMSDKSIEKEIEIDIDYKEKNTKKEVRHKYGEYKNVLLSESDFNELEKEWGMELLLKRIENLSSSIKSKGYRYKDFKATLKNWAKKEGSFNSFSPKNNVDKFKGEVNFEL